MPSSSPISLGPFTLLAPLGAGAMGEVWRASYGTLPVALKLLTATGARSTRFREALENEVHAVAGLTHAHVIRVYDHGTVSEQAAAASQGRLPLGAPYLAMELADGPLQRFIGRDWTSVAEILGQVLEGLAHAHAHGIVHRDLKPDNLLRFGASHYKIADFGVARPLGAPDEGARISGTPGYMAPEQARGAVREQGPGTDLYALGCVAWELITGQPPFGWDTGSSPSFRRVAALPPLPAFVVAQLPAGCEEWLRTLLAESPDDRFACAADALAALHALGDAPAAPARLERVPAASIGATWTDDALLAELVEAPQPSSPGRRPPPAPCPSDWRPRHRFEVPRARGLGLRLFGLRAVPLAGREQERDTLWQALREVHDGRQPRAVLLRGLAGEGKSALARWLCERASEVGAAVPLWVSHGAVPGPTDGLGPALARHFRCLGLDLAQTRAQLQRRLPDGDPLAIAALARMIAEGTGADAEQRGLLRWALSREDRPVVLALDDAQWSAEALQLAREVLASRLPVLVVLTLREDLLPSLPEASADVAALAEADAVRSLSLGPLPRADRQRLVRDLLGLEEGLAARVEERTAGNPLFVVHLVGDWVQRGVLVPGPDGFVLADGARSDLPDDLYGVVGAQVDALLAERPATDRPALEIAAALGLDVREDDWRAACDRAGVPPSPGLLGVLREHRLLRADRHGHAVFAHGMLRDALVREARRAGRWAAHHRAIAAALGEEAEPARRGVHLLEAGQLVEALGPLLAGARARRSEPRSALALLARWEQAMRQAGVDASDPRWVRGFVLRAVLLQDSGAWEDAATWASRAAEQARTHGHLALECEALLEVSYVQSAQLNNADALATVERARELAVHGDAHLQAKAANHLAAVLTNHARYDEALAVLKPQIPRLRPLGPHLELLHALGRVAVLHGLQGDHAEMTTWARDAIEVAEALGMPGKVAGGLQRLAGAALQAGHYDDAELHARRALATYETLGQPLHVAHCQLALADAARYRGDYPSAEALLDEAIATYRVTGTHPGAPRMSMGLVYLGCGRIDEGSALIEEVRAGLERDGRLAWLGACHAFLLAASLDDDDAWDRHLTRARQLLDETRLAHRDVLWAASLAADRAEAKGDTRRAGQALELALAQARGLGNRRAEASILARR